MDTQEIGQVKEEEGRFLSDKLELFYRTVRPIAPASMRLVIVHGYGDHSGRYLEPMRFWAERGVACHALDLRGQGRSAGRRGFVRQWEEYVADVEAFLAQPLVRGEGPLFVLGHSHGGLVVAAGVIEGKIGPGVAGIILSAPFFANAMSLSGGKRWLGRAANWVLPAMRVGSGIQGTMLSSDPAMSQGDDPYAVRTATPRWWVTHQRVQRECLARAAEFRLPVLVMYGDADPIADPAAVRRFYAACGSHQKALQVYPGQLHELLRERERRKTFEDVWRWMGGGSVKV